MWIFRENFLPSPSLIFYRSIHGALETRRELFRFPGCKSVCYGRARTYAHRTTKSGHPILLSRIRPRRPADFDDRFEVAHALLTVGTRWSRTSVRPCTCENPFREGEGRCQTVFFVGRTKGSKKHVPRGKKNRKGSNTYIARAKRGGGERQGERERERN